MTGPAPWISTAWGWITPIASLQTSAYGTLAISARGDISGSASTVTPSQRDDPSNTLASNGSIDPSCTEK